jgi:hypothetical protein
MQCAAMNKISKVQCKRRTCLYLPYCFQHVRSELKVYVKPSLIPGAGLGLFAAEDIKNNAIIAHLSGEIISEDEQTRRYTDEATAPYVVQEPGGTLRDGALMRYVGHYSNTRLGQRKQSIRANTNADIKRCHGQPGVHACIKASKLIRRDEEILTYYGDRYEMNPDFTSSTRRK